MGVGRRGKGDVEEGERKEEGRRGREGLEDYRL